MVKKDGITTHSQHLEEVVNRLKGTRSDRARHPVFRMATRYHRRYGDQFLMNCVRNLEVRLQYQYCHYQKTNHCQKNQEKGHTLKQLRESSIDSKNYQVM